MRLATLPLTIALGSCSLVPGTTANLEKQARRIMAPALYDPAAAQFQELRTVKMRNGEKLVDVICGEMNGKNKVGGYVGFRRFIVSLSDKTSIVDLQLSDDFKPVSSEDYRDLADQRTFEAAWPACEEGRPR